MTIHRRFVPVAMLLWTVAGLFAILAGERTDAIGCFILVVLFAIYDNQKEGGAL